MNIKIATIMLPTEIHLSGRGRSFARRCHVFDNNKKQRQPSSARTKKESSRRSRAVPENDEDRYTLRQRYEESKSNSRIVLQRMSCKSNKKSNPPKRQASTDSTDSTRRQDPGQSPTTVALQSDPPQGSFLRPSRKVITTTLRRHTMASKVSFPTNLPVRERTVVNRYPTIDREGQTLPIITFQPTTRTPRRHTWGNEECCIHDTWYFSSNHVLVNRERVERGIPVLRRSIRLDELARDHAQKLAEGGFVTTKSSIPANTFRGHSISQIHQATMCREGQCTERENILNPDLNEFGMATKKGTDGLLYLVQFFDSVPVDTRVEI
jgi:hypothetical protein